MPETIAPRKRLTSLDAVRGIAAFVVILHHCYLAMPDEPLSKFNAFLWSRPLRVFHNGPAAVIIFFVLSGYVLALPFFNGTQPSYARYIAKRVCRIYIPFAIAICIAVFVYLVTARHPVAVGTSWFNTSWPETWPGFVVLGGHFLMIGTQPTIKFDGVIWSLVHEMRISIIFPLLIILCQDTRRALLLAGLTVIVSIKILVALAQAGPGDADNFLTSLLWTLRVVPYFIIGILLSKHSRGIRSIVEALPEKIRLALIAVPMMIFCFGNNYMSVSHDFFYDISAALLIVLVLDTPKVDLVLNRSCPQWLGRISYSLYLIHMPILLAFGYLMLGRFSFGLFALAVVITSLAAATLMQIFVEAPAIKLGQRLARTKRQPIDQIAPAAPFPGSTTMNQKTPAQTAIRVINLPGSADRRAAFTEMARDTKLDWAFFPACTSLLEPLRYDARMATRRCGRPLSPAEIACYASHFKIWEWLAVSDYDQAIIFEDDVLVAWEVIEQIAAHRFADHGVDLLRLFITHPFDWKIAKYRLFSPQTHLVRPVGMQFGGQAYLLTRAAARALVSNYAVAAAPLDWVLGRYWEHRLASYCIFPFPVIERHSPSTIGEARNAVPKRALYDRIANIVWRVRDRAERAYVECCLMKKYPLGLTEDAGPPFLPPIETAPQAAAEPAATVPTAD